MERLNSELQAVGPGDGEEMVDARGVSDVDPGLYEKMLRGVRSWGIWSGIFGLLQFVASGFLSAPWGVVLLLVAFGSFFFRSASMCVVYGVVMAWAAIANLLSGEVGWIVLAILQSAWSIRLFRRFSEFRRAGLTQSPALESSDHGVDYRARAERLFPWASLVLGAGSFLGVVCILSTIFGLVLFSQPGEAIPYETVLDFLLGLFISVGVLAMALGLASIMSRHRRRWPAIAGLIAGTVIVVAVTVLGFLLSGPATGSPLSA